MTDDKNYKLKIILALITTIGAIILALIKLLPAKTTDPPVKPVSVQIADSGKTYIAGMVIDMKGNPIKLAKIQVVGLKTFFTDDNGSFREELPAKAQGSYRIVVTQANYGTYDQLDNLPNEKLMLQMPNK